MWYLSQWLQKFECFKTKRELKCQNSLETQSVFWRNNWRFIFDVVKRLRLSIIYDGSLHSFKNLIQILVTCNKSFWFNLDFLRNSDSSSTKLTFCSSFFLENLSSINQKLKNELWLLLFLEFALVIYLVIPKSNHLGLQ